MIGTLPMGVKINWQEHVATLVHTYNCTRSNATGFRLYFLMYGRHLMLPIAIEVGVWTPDITSISTHKCQHILFRKYLSFKLSGLLISSSNKSEEGTSKF